MSSCSPLRFRAPLQRVGLFFVLAALSACDVPTEVPQFDVRWVFSVLEDTIAVDQLLPATGVTISGGNFLVEADTVLLNETLSSLCSACGPLNGLNVPKPLFDTVFTQTGNLATDVVSVEMVSGSISLALQNNLGFDPIRPAAAAPGMLIVTLYDGNALGRLLALDTLDGSVLTDSVPNGAITTIPLNLAPGTVSSTIYAEVDLLSPLGDPVLIDINAAFDITATVVTFLVSSVTVDVHGLSVSVDPTDLDVGDIDAETVERIQMGSLIFDIQNPFGVGVTLFLDISGPAFPTIQKRVDINSDQTSTVTVGYTGAELQSFLGQDVVLVSGSGTVVSPGVPPVPAIVTPSQVMVIEVNLDIELEIG